jgi:hypothetical protein
MATAIIPDPKIIDAGIRRRSSIYCEFPIFDKIEIIIAVADNHIRM